MPLGGGTFYSIGGKGSLVQSPLFGIFQYSRGTAPRFGPGGGNPPPCLIVSRCAAAIALAGAWGSCSPAPDPLEGEGPGGAARLVDLSCFGVVLRDCWSSILSCISSGISPLGGCSLDFRDPGRCSRGGEGRAYTSIASISGEPVAAAAVWVAVVLGPNCRLRV